MTGAERYEKSSEASCRRGQGKTLTVKAKPMRNARVLEIQVSTAIRAPSLCGGGRVSRDHDKKRIITKDLRCAFKELMEYNDNQERRPTVAGISTQSHSNHDS